MYKNKKIIAVIPARSGSKGIKNKNIRNFCGKPLIAYSILQAKALKRRGMDFRLIVSTEDKKIAKISKKYGAEVPFLRPKEMAEDNSLVMDAVLYTLNRLKEEEGYIPDYILLLQATSPLRRAGDIYRCLDEIQEKNTDAVLAVCLTSPLFYNLSKDGRLLMVNKIKNKKFKKGRTIKGFKRQAFPKGYKINGAVFIIKREKLIKEKTFVPEGTKAVICDAWRSVDLDSPEDFVLAESLFKNKEKLKNEFKNFRM